MYAVIESTTFSFSRMGIRALLRSENSYCRDSVHLSRTKCLLTTVWTFTRRPFVFRKDQRCINTHTCRFYLRGSLVVKEAWFVIFHQSFRVTRLLPFRTSYALEDPSSRDIKVKEEEKIRIYWLSFSFI